MTKMMYRLKLILHCLCLAILSTTTITAEGTFEDAELVNEFITMSFSSSHPYDLRHTIPGEPDIDYPIYNAVPKTNFDCNGRHEGYYADIETRCQVFRICANTDLIGRGFAFLCPNGTLFSQKNFVCDWYRNVDCSDSERFYSKNDGNRIGTKNEIMETVRQMMEHPMKTITIALNRGKPITPQPITHHNPGFSTTQNSNIFRTTVAPRRNIPTQQIITRRQPVTLHQIENASGLSQSYQQNQFKPGLEPQDFTSVERVRFNEQSSIPLVPSTNPFMAPIETALPVSTANQSPILSQKTPLGTVPSDTSITSPETSSNNEEVYVSSLGELSTDTGANFDRQTARIIAEPTSSSINVQVISKSESLSADKMNFAEKVNAGLNGLQVANQNEIIAPEYVQNILHQNIPIPENTIQPPSYEFASNINSLLDEVAYEAELEGQNSVQVQLQTPSDGVNGSTRKPFRFLSRGFSYENTRQNGPYVYGPATATRNSLPRIQHLTSTQSYSNSLLTTSFFTSPAPVTSTEATHNLIFVKPSDQPTIKPATDINLKPETSSDFNGRATNELIQRDSLVKGQSGTKIDLADTAQKGGLVNERIDYNFESKTRLELDSKPKSSTEEKEEKKQGIVSILPQESEDGDKANANKRAEKLLLAGVKQTILDNLSEQNKKNDTGENMSIVPLYIRVTEPQTVSSTITPIAASPITTTPSTFTLTSQSTSTLGTASTTTSTPTPPTTTTQSSRRYTISNVHRRQASRSIVHKKRQNFVRAVASTTTTTSSPNVKVGSVSTANTTRLTASIRKRPTVSRYSFGSRRSVASTNTTSTSVDSSKRIAIRSSDKEVSDLTAVASTYNTASKRGYNSIRQNSYKYTQPQRRRPSHNNNGSETTTISAKTTTTITTHVTTPKPRRSSSLPTSTLAPFSHEVISATSTTPEPLPATYLSFNDLTKAIIDDSILQTFRRNQDYTGSTIRPPTNRNQLQTPIKQQLPAFVTTTPRSLERPTQKTTVQSASRVPLVPLKEYIASKFGAHYSPAPPSLSIARPVQPTLAPTNEPHARVQSVYATQYPTQQYVARQDYTPRTVVTIRPAPAVNHVLQQTIAKAIQPNIAHQHSQYVVQQPQQIPQQNYFQLRQQKPLPVQQYQVIQSVQPVQHLAHRFLTQQQDVQRQPQRTTIHQGQQILQRTIPPAQQQIPQLQQFQRNEQLQQQKTLSQLQPAQPRRQQSHIQIFPSQVTSVQTIPPQYPNTVPNTNIVPPEVGSVNVHLPTNLAGLIPNTNLFDIRPSSESLGRAQNRIDQLNDEIDKGPEKVSAYSGVTSYEVPLSSIGRLANDITHLLRKIRRR